MGQLDAKRRFDFPFTPGTEFSRIKVQLEFQHGGWFPTKQDGIHPIFWLARNRYRSNTYGLITTRGPGKALVSMLTNVNLPKGSSQRFVQNILLQPGASYLVDYVYDRANSRIELFKLTENGLAVRVPVQLGRSSVTTIEIVEGLQEGDEVILSDISTYDDEDRIRLVGRP